MQHNNKPLLPLLIGALGVAFGDIGTSPLYTIRECFLTTGMAVNGSNLLGILSFITWALTLVVTLKYVSIMLRADNRGEGGILALTTLAVDQLSSTRKRAFILTLGLLGAALFYGDSLITPAISVLSAVEGLHIATPAVDNYVRPISLFILIALFGLQRHGTATVGVLFGPIMLVWFLVLGLTGLIHIAYTPGILAALSPHHAVHFALSNPVLAFMVLGAVVLAITGAEALYADMGHFGRTPIQKTWLYLVFPCLLLNYFGQGALLLNAPDAISNPFFHMVPEGLTLPLVVLATLATVIASQAVITGAFSVTQQAIMLGYLPRMATRHTSSSAVGQIYIPMLNWLLCVGVTLLVVGFGTSSNLASAYGLAVTGAMLIDTILVTSVLRRRNRWAWYLLAPFTLVFFTVDTTLFTANLHKIAAGGWFPLLLAGCIFFIMHTWVRGREQSHALMLAATPPLATFLEGLDTTLPKVPRTSIFLTSDLNHAPPALIHNLAHNGVWHAQTIIMKISRARIPRYPNSERVAIHHHSHGLSTVQVTYGFMEEPNIPQLIAKLPEFGLDVHHPSRLSYFLGTHTYIPSPNKALNKWQEPLFITLDKFAHSAVSYFKIPREQVIEIGSQIEI
ncbi:MAG: potassium transporter Kup [Proteobacteria bacterium]|nr:potassium transporter Kup [Pseudomonadota bacterium]